jgi:two-component system, NtrC family, nitrogen regulation response regulator GlnG
VVHAGCAGVLTHVRRDIHDGPNRAFESALILKALEHTGGRRIEAATLLGIGRSTPTREVQELQLDLGNDACHE